jgi:hypothetical protein
MAHIPDAPLKLHAFQKHSPSARRALQADVRPNPVDGPIGAAAWVLLAQRHGVACVHDHKCHRLAFRNAAF